MRSMKTLVAVLAVAVFLAIAGSASAANVWDSGGGADQSWGTGLNWDDNAVPSTGARAYINNGGTAQVPDVRQIGAFTIGNGGADSGTLIIPTGGSLTTTTTNPPSYSYVGVSGTGNLQIGGSLSIPITQLRVGINNAANGTVTQTGGSVDTTAILLGYNAGSTGNYNLSGPASTVDPTGTMWVGYRGTGTLTQSDGAVTVGGDLRIGEYATGTVTQTGGSVNANRLLLGRVSTAQGFYTLSGAASSVTAAGDMWVGHQGDGTFTMNDGSVQAGTLYVGLERNGVFTQNDGSVQTGNLELSRGGGSGGTTYDINSGSLTTTGFARLASWRPGVFTQTGGTVSIGTDLWMTHSTATATADGTYNLQGGELEVGGTIIKGNKPAAFDMTGGTLILPGEKLTFFDDNAWATKAPIIEGWYDLAEDKTTFGAGVAPDFAIDVNDGTSPTAPGWTGIAAAHSGNGGTVTVDGVRFDVFSSDGARDRGAPNSATGDFIFDDGAGQAVGLRIYDLPDGIWEAKVWSWDNGATVGNQIVGLAYTGGPEIIQTTTFAANPTEPFTFLFDSSQLDNGFGIFTRENNSNSDRARFNALQLTYVPEPATMALTALALTGLGGYLRRRRKTS